VASLLFADNSKLPDFFMRISMASQEGERTLRISDTLLTLYKPSHLPGKKQIGDKT
jgi:hypothetical protein